MFKGDFQLASPAPMPNGEQVARYTARFKQWAGTPVEDTWNGKPTIDFEGNPQWGEFAVLLSLTDGWEGYDVECYGAPHGSAFFWRSSPFHPPDRKHGLPPPAHVELFLKTIGLQNRKNGNGLPRYAGCWDVIAWRGNEYRIIEAKWHGHDNMRSTQDEWFEAARRAGISLDTFIIVEWVFDSLPHPVLSSARRTNVSRVDRSGTVPNITIKECQTTQEKCENTVINLSTSVPSAALDSTPNEFDTLYRKFLDNIEQQFSVGDVLVKRTPACIRTFQAIDGYNIILEGIDERRLTFIVTHSQMKKLYDAFSSIEAMKQYEVDPSPKLGPRGVYRLNKFVGKNATECEPLFMMLKDFESFQHQI